MKVKIRKLPSARSRALSSKCSSGGVVVISIQVGYCWLWSLIFQIQRYYSVVIATQDYCTLVPPALGFGSAPRKRGFGGRAPDKKFWDVCWPTVLQTHGIGLTLEFSHCISPIKERILKRLSMVLYCIGREIARA